MSRRVQIVYKNHRGEVATRCIIPLKIWFGVSEYHEDEGEQWFLQAWDLIKHAERDFAVKDIKAWKQVTPTKEKT